MASFTPEYEAIIREYERKLAVCARWMERQVKEDMLKISKRRSVGVSTELRETFTRENQNEIIGKRIRGYFGDLLLLNAPKGTLDQLIHSEITYYGLQHNPQGDGLGVIGAYTKILDTIIESFLTNGYRKYCQKNKREQLFTNDPLEKALHLVVTKKYQLSVGRLFGLIKAIRNKEPLYEYGTAFHSYLQKYDDKSQLLLDDTFWGLFSKVVSSDVFGGKRHNGKINLQETLETREILVGNYEKKNSVLYILLEGMIL